jgi:hypothetical protein
MFSHFKLIRLGKDKPLPSWNAVSFFVLDSSCQDHSYVIESMKRHQQSPFLAAPHIMTSNNTGLFMHGMYWPTFMANTSKYLRLVKERPMILKLWGEVFWRFSLPKVHVVTLICLFTGK